MTAENLNIIYDDNGNPAVLDPEAYEREVRELLALMLIPNNNEVAKRILEVQARHNSLEYTQRIVLGVANLWTWTIVEELHPTDNPAVLGNLSRLTLAWRSIRRDDEGD